MKVIHRAYVVLCAIWYYLYNLKKVKSTHEGVLLFVFYSTRARACIFLLNKMVVKIVPSKFHGLCAKSLGDLAKCRYFQDSIIAAEAFVNTSYENWFFIFLMMLQKYVHMS